MVARVLASQVQSLTGFQRDCTPFVELSDLIVDEHLVDKGLSEKMLAAISLQLAAHYATLAEERGALAASTLGDASERYHNVYAGGFRMTRFGQQALMLDTTNTLSQLSYTAENEAKLEALFRVV